jgi:hypothetical protein
MEMLLESVAWIAVGFVPTLLVWKCHGVWVRLQAKEGWREEYCNKQQLGE